MNFEEIARRFGMDSPLRIYEEQFTSYLAEALSNSFYNYVNIERLTESEVITFNSNEDLWYSVFNNKVHITKNIELKEFCVIEWLPASPGRYFTSTAKSCRVTVENMAEYMGPLGYIPAGKAMMIEGGIGSIRLNPDGPNCYLCASANGISHQGIPIVISKHIYSKYIDQIKQTGYLLADVIGHVISIPKTKWILNYPKEVPRYALCVTGIRPKNIDKLRNISVSVSMIYSTEKQITDEKFHTYKFFDPSPSCPEDMSLIRAVNWIEEYCKSYSDGSSPIYFLSDFDEQVEHFSSVDFPIKSIMQGIIPEKIVNNYSTIYNFNDMSKNTVKGKNNTLIHSGSGDVVIKSSFNTESNAALLDQIQRIVNDNGDQSAKKIFGEFKSELSKENPKRSVLKSLWDQVVKLVPFIKSSTDLFEKVQAIIN